MTLVLMVAGSSVAVTACDNSGADTDTKRSLLETGVSAVQLSPAALSVTGIGTVIEMSLIVSLRNGKVLLGVKENAVDPVSLESFDVEWSSDNEFIAIFDEPGQLRAVSAGQTTVRATVDGIVSEAEVNVEAVTSLNPLDVESIISLHVAHAIINPSDVFFDAIGDTLILQADLTYSDTVLDTGIKKFYHHPNGKFSGQLVWTSSDPTVVEVIGSGAIRAVGAGTATITVDDPWKELFPQADITVTVEPMEEGGDAPDPDPDPGIVEEDLPLGADPYADSVNTFTKGTNGGFNEGLLPGIVLGSPKGGGCCTGSTDVLSLGVGGEIILEFTDFIIFDGADDDFIVFENAFEAGGNPDNVFAEPATVAVSDDGVTWHAFPCNTSGAPYTGCAGTKATLANPDDNTIDPTDPTVAGGNAYDLADTGLLTARYVKITDSGLGLGPIGPSTGGFDLDAVSIVHGTVP